MKKYSLSQLLSYKHTKGREGKEREGKGSKGKRKKGKGREGKGRTFARPMRGYLMRVFVGAINDVVWKSMNVCLCGSDMREGSPQKFTEARRGGTMDERWIRTVTKFSAVRTQRMRSWAFYGAGAGEVLHPVTANEFRLNTGGGGQSCGR